MLRGTYWARDRDRATTQRNVENAAVLLAAHRGRELVATARVVAVQRKVNWLFDVVVADAERGRGLGSRVLQRILDHPALAEATRLFLDTRDAMPFYQRFGFRELERDNHANSSLMVAHLRLRRP
jgi:N-acetylglutamate synthase-like GNAT family acetyltransferase